MSFVPVARLADIPSDRGLAVHVGGVDIGLYLVDECVYAMEDTCPHAGFPLSEGELEGCVITCDAHGWPFDVRTGFDPENADGFPIPCFAVFIEEGMVHVDLEHRINHLRRERDSAKGTTAS
jgi:nitrite reductase/ring-hydroxylating ferredoxin subunit